jgi:hypothetical protein
MARRAALKPGDKCLLARIRGQHRTADEWRWVLTHLDPRAPPVLVQGLHAKLIMVEAGTSVAIQCHADAAPGASPGFDVTLGHADDR